MPVISGGGGGGTAFNGGTISGGLAVVPSAAPTTLDADLVVNTKQIVADGNAVVLVEGPSGVLVEIDSDGGGTIYTRGDGSIFTIQNNAGSAAALNIIGAAAGTRVGFFGAAGAAKPTVAGAKLPADAVMASLLTGLVALGLVLDTTT